MSHELASGTPRGSHPAQGARTRRVDKQHFAADKVVSASGLPLYLRNGAPVPPPELPAGVRIAKRALDLAVALPALIVAAPVMVGIALAIRLTSGGPVLFRQTRLGYLGRPFDILKFRTLKSDACDDSGVRQVDVDDERLTPVGAFLRDTSLDELPQLLNVVLGNMSLVGPRPHVAGQLAAGRPYDELVPYYDMRTLAVPGLTGWAQANGLRGSTADAVTARARVDHDLAYVQNVSLLLDVRIVIQTLRREFLRVKAR